MSSWGLKASMDAFSHLIRSRHLPERAKAGIARRALTEAHPSVASDLVKAFASDEIVTGRGPTAGLTEELLRSRKSLVRFGDGEALLLLGKPTWFQLPDVSLRSGLFEAFFDYGPDTDYLLAVPGPIFSPAAEIKSMDEKSGSKIWRNFKKSRGLEAVARYVGSRRAPVFDAFTYRSGLEDPSPLWESAEDLVLVSNRRALLESRTVRRFGDARVHHIEVPEIDVLPHLDRICREVRRTIEASGQNAREVPVLVAAGAVGKLVVLRLMSDFTVLDLGAYVAWSIPRESRPSLHRKKT